MKIQIISSTCRRCGKPMAKLNRSLYGCDKLKTRLDRICTDYITVDEAQEILIGQTQAILAHK